MKLVQGDKEKLVFQLSSRERKLLLDVLSRYPVVPAANKRHRVSPAESESAETQRLLDESLESHRRENRKQIEALLHQSGRFKEIAAGYQLTLSLSETEWLLQVLNDVRVGSWIHLGSPDVDAGDKIPLDSKNTAHLWLMETAGYFEMVLLEALGAPPM